MSNTPTTPSQTEAHTASQIVGAIERFDRNAAFQAERGDALKARLVEVIGSATVDTLADTVEQIAKCEAACIVHTKAGNVLRNGHTFADVRIHLTEDVLIQGAEDTWSGRGNDLRRAKHDAARAAVRDVFNLLDRFES